MTFRIPGLDPAPFRPLFGLDETALPHKASPASPPTATMAFPTGWNCGTPARVRPYCCWQTGAADVHAHYARRGCYAALIEPA